MVKPKNKQDELNYPFFNETELLAIELLANREVSGMTLQQCADEIGVTVRTLNNWVNKKTGFQKAINERAKQLIENLSPKILATISTALASNDEKIKIKGMDAFMKINGQLEVGEHNQKAMDLIDKKVMLLKKTAIEFIDLGLDEQLICKYLSEYIRNWNGADDTNIKMTQHRLIKIIEERDF